MASPGRLRRGAWLGLCAALAAVPGYADATEAPPAPVERSYTGFKFEPYLHKWSVNSWTVWALADHTCIAITEIPYGPPNNFWGFRVVNGLDVKMFFGAIENARPRTITIEYSDGESINSTTSYAAAVESFSGFDGYVVPIKLEDLWAFTDHLFFDAYVGSEKVAWSGTKVMGKVAEGLEKCDNWQDAH
jgi:hypothetical protein